MIAQVDMDMTTGLAAHAHTSPRTDEGRRRLPAAGRWIVAALLLVIGVAGPLSACERSAEESEQFLRLGLSNIITLDPAKVQDSSSAFYVTHLFSGLVSLNEEFEVVPILPSAGT